MFNILLSLLCCYLFYVEIFKNVFFSFKENLNPVHHHTSFNFPFGFLVKDLFFPSTSQLSFTKALSPSDLNPQVFGLPSPVEDRGAHEIYGKSGHVTTH